MEFSGQLPAQSPVTQAYRRKGLLQALGWVGGSHGGVKSELSPALVSSEALFSFPGL